MTQTSDVFVKQVVFLTVNHRGPLPLRELHSTGETTVWRDPGGSWACLPPVYDYGWNHPATGCDTCLRRSEKYRQKNGSKRREWTKRNVNKNKLAQLVKRRRNSKIRLKKEAIGANKGTILSTKLNSTTTKRTWTEESPRESPRMKQWHEKGALRCANNNKTTKKAFLRKNLERNKHPKNKSSPSMIKTTEPHRRLFLRKALKQNKHPKNKSSPSMLKTTEPHRRPF